MKRLFSLLLSVLLLAGFATGALAGPSNLSSKTPWKTVGDVAPRAVAEGMFGDSYPFSPSYAWPQCASDPILKGTVITGVASDGRTHCWQDGTDNASFAFDGKVKTFFDPYDAVQQSWCGLLLDQQYELSEVRVCSRDGWEDRIIGGAIQGSNDNGATWKNVVYFKPAVYGDKPLLSADYHIVSSAANPRYVQANIDAGVNKNKADFSVFWVGGGYYNMYRYVNLDGNHGDVAEIELYGHTAKNNIEYTGLSASTANGSVPGKVIGTGGLWADGVNGYADAWDGRGSTFYDPKVPGPTCWTGLLADYPTVLSEVRILPRLEFFDRTDGAYIQGSNDGRNWVSLAYFTAGDCLAAGSAQTYIKKTVKNANAYWMFRYVNDGTSHGDVADVTLIGTKGEASLTYPGLVVGTVLSTDIRAYINGAEIPAYNIGGKLAVLVSDLNNYGFKTAFDNNLRKTAVKRDKSATKFSSVPSKASGLPIGSPVMSVYSTDIRVELDGKEVPAFNVDNRMAIYFTELKQYGDVTYDNATRSSSLKLK